MSSILDISHVTVHSAQVQMHLEVAGQSLAIAQMGPDFLILEQPVELPATWGDVVMRIDASERRWSVSLPDGLSAVAQRTRIARK